MHIRQVAVHYHAEADRLLLRVRSSADQVFAVWLTRRLMRRLWPHLSSAVQRAGATHALAHHADRSAAPVAPLATPTPGAAAMLAASTRERTLEQADFSQPFQTHAAEQPLGPEPLLAHVVQMTPRPQGRLHLALRDERQRSIELELDATLATAIRELMLAALRQAEWGLDADAMAAPQDDAPRVLN